jgi:translation initiation factor 1
MSIENLKVNDPFAFPSNTQAITGTTLLHFKSKPLLRSTQKQLSRIPNPPRSLFMSIENLKVNDPFADDVGDTQPKNYVHIRIQQRNGRKTLTTVQGLSKEYSPKALLKAFKKEYACNGTIIQDKDMGEVIQLQGDHRTKVMDFLTDKGSDKMGKYALAKENIKIHGF